MIAAGARYPFQHKKSLECYGTCFAIVLRLSRLAVSARSCYVIATLYRQQHSTQTLSLVDPLHNPVASGFSSL
jgi:hypothetical protein